MYIKPFCTIRRAITQYEFKNSTESGRIMRRMQTAASRRRCHLEDLDWNLFVPLISSFLVALCNSCCSMLKGCLKTVKEIYDATRCWCSSGSEKKAVTNAIDAIKRPPCFHHLRCSIASRTKIRVITRVERLLM